MFVLASTQLRNHANDAFQAIEGLCDIYPVLNLECCKCAQMRFYHQDSLWRHFRRKIVFMSLP